MCLGLELELCRLLGGMMLRNDVGLDMELRLTFGRCLSRSFSIFSIRTSSSTGSFGSRWGF